MTEFRKFLSAADTCLGALLLVALSMTGAQRASAQMTLNPYADAQYEHDSNVFRQQNSEANLLAVGDPKLGDTDLKYLGGLDGTYLWSDQKLVGKFEFRRQDFDHYSELDHNEYLADMTLNWKLTSLFDGTLGARQESSMAPFVLGNSTRLTIDVDRNISGRANLNFNPDWRLETGIFFHNLKSPLQDYPDFDERELGTHLGIVNLSVTNLTYGFGIDHLDGDYEHAPDVGSYTQTSGQFKANYLVSGLTSVNAAIGYTKRTQNASEGSVSAMTGALGYSRQLTAKTGFTLQITRAVNSYLAAGASEIDTSATAGLLWQATYRIGVGATVGYIHSAFVGEAVPGTDTNGRVDHSPTESLNITYQVLRRLKFHAYLNKQSRTSDVQLYNFSDTLIGIDAKFTWR
jgi:hypothetical protein